MLLRYLDKYLEPEVYTLKDLDLHSCVSKASRCTGHVDISLDRLVILALSMRDPRVANYLEV